MTHTHTHTSNRVDTLTKMLTKIARNFSIKHDVEFTDVLNLMTETLQTMETSLNEDLQKQLDQFSPRIDPRD